MWLGNARYAVRYDVWDGVWYRAWDGVGYSAWFGAWYDVRDDILHTVWKPLNKEIHDYVDT